MKADKLVIGIAALAIAGLLLLGGEDLQRLFLSLVNSEERLLKAIKFLQDDIEKIKDKESKSIDDTTAAETVQGAKQAVSQAKALYKNLGGKLGPEGPAKKIEGVGASDEVLGKALDLLGAAEKIYDKAKETKAKIDALPDTGEGFFAEIYDNLGDIVKDIAEWLGIARGLYDLLKSTGLIKGSAAIDAGFDAIALGAAL